MEAYSKGIHKIQQHGPAAYSQIIDFATQFVGQEPVTQEKQFYTILVMITNGLIQDYRATVDSIVNASNYPISIVLVTVGDQDISKIRTLDGEQVPLTHSETGEKAGRDMV